MNVAANLERSAFYFPHHTAVIEGDRKISFLEFDQEANRVATALMGAGVQKGDRVALCTPNSFAWLAFYFGVLRVVGSVGTPVSITEVQIRDLQGTVLSPGVEGEICIQGPNVMKRKPTLRPIIWHQADLPRI